MGRVSRYKKIKDCDPFSSKNGGRIDEDTIGVWGFGDNGRKPKKRSKTAEKLRAKRKKTSERPVFDSPPSDEDDFDLSDLVGSLKRKKNTEVNDTLHQPIPILPTVSSDAPSKGPTPSLNELEDIAERKEQKLLNLERQVVPEKKVVEHEGRMEGESKRAFHKRVKAETRQIIRNAKVQAHNPEKKRKRKEFLKNKKKKRKTGDAYTDSEDELLPKDEIAFGEQAERPPIFHQLPRGAKKK